jgi:hypothetical protein
MKKVGENQEMRNAYKILVKKPEGKRTAEYLGVYGSLILECILEEQVIKDVGWNHLAR